MANYTVDILVALKGAQKLTAFNKQLKETEEISKVVNKNTKLLAKDNELVIRSFNNLNKALKDATANFNAAASGTSIQKKAARELILAEKDLNKELKERERLLQSITLTGQRSSLMPGRSRTLLGQSVTPEGGASGRSRQILREQQELQAALARMNQRSFGKFKFLPPEELTGQSEDIFRGQSSPVAAKIQQTLKNRKQSEKEIAKMRERLIKKEQKLLLTRKKILKEEILIRTKTLRENQFANINQGAGGFRAFSKRADKITAQANRPGLGQIIGSQFAEGGIFASPGGRSARARGALQSGLIGGGFPLLFGQGGAGAIAGGLGGLAGGALSPGFGFAGSIVATAAAQEIKKVLEFRKQISDLNIEMKSMGISSNISANSVTKLGKSLGITKEEAVKVIEQFKRFGDASIGLAKFFDGDFALFESFSKSGDVSSVLNAIKQSSKDLTVEEELRITRLLTQKGAEVAINELIDVRRKKLLQIEKDKIKVKQFDAANPTGEGTIDQQISNKLKLDEFSEKSNETIEDLLKIRDGLSELKIAGEEVGLSIVAEIEKIDKELRKLNNTQFQTIELSKAISSSFEDSFKGIIRGTMTVQDAFRNMLNKIADFFIESAARIAATQFQKGLLGILGQGLGGALGGSGLAFGAGNLGINKASDFLGGPNPFKADGGPVKRGGSFIVGERGPELFTPGVSGMITPNHALGGSTSVVVNVDASGSSVEGDEEQANAFGSAIATAIQSELIKQKRPGGLLA